MAEDLGQEDVIGLVTGFEAVAEDGGVGAAQVAWFPRVGPESRRRLSKTTHDQSKSGRVLGFVQERVTHVARFIDVGRV